MVVRVENSLRFAGDCVIAQNPSFGIWEHEVAGSNPVAPTSLAIFNPKRIFVELPKGRFLAVVYRRGEIGVGSRAQ